jgi:hypothetical protein
MTHLEMFSLYLSNIIFLGLTELERQERREEGESPTVAGIESSVDRGGRLIIDRILAGGFLREMPPDVQEAVEDEDKANLPERWRRWKQKRLRH